MDISTYENYFEKVVRLLNRKIMNNKYHDEVVNLMVQGFLHNISEEETAAWINYKLLNLNKVQ